MAYAFSRRSKIYLLPIALLLAVIAVTALLRVSQARELGRKDIETFHSEILRIRRQELNNYLDLAFTAIADERRTGGPVGRERAKEVLCSMSYGQGGYLFACGHNGLNRVHPKLPQLEGRDLINLRDPDGDRVIRNPIARGVATTATVARAGSCRPVDEYVVVRRQQFEVNG